MVIGLLSLEKDALRNREIRLRVQLLMDHRDAGTDGFRGSVGGVRLAFEKDLAFILTQKTDDDLHQRRFACAVFAEQRVNFSALYLQLHILQRVRATEGFADSLTIQNVFGVFVCIGHCIQRYHFISTRILAVMDELRSSAVN